MTHYRFVSQTIFPDSLLTDAKHAAFSAHLQPWPTLQKT